MFSKVSTPAAVCLVMAAMMGCVNPSGKFDEFEQKFPDGDMPDPMGDPITDEFDINGEFLLGLSVVPVNPDVPFQFIATVDFSPLGAGAGVINNISFEPLKLFPANEATREIVTANETFVAANISGTFDLPVSGTLLSEANPITGSMAVLDARVFGQIVSADLFCGDVIGSAVTSSNIDLAGSTFAAIRITPGTRGANLPEVVAKCP